MINEFGNAIVRNDDNCKKCKGSGIYFEAISFNEEVNSVHKYCECGEKIGEIPDLTELFPHNGKGCLGPGCIYCDEEDDGRDSPNTVDGSVI